MLLHAAAAAATGNFLHEAAGNDIRNMSQYKAHQNYITSSEEDEMGAAETISRDTVSLHR
jgi:hypothetical protein